jgi:hypothetical protein
VGLGGAQKSRKASFTDEAREYRSLA